MKVRTLLIGVLLALGVPLLVGSVVIGAAAVQLPAPQGPRISGPHGLVGLHVDTSYAWIVPVSGGVVVIDTGMEPEAVALRRELAGREVLATLLTSAHAFHATGVDALADSALYLGADDLPLLRGEAEPAGWFARWVHQAVPRPRLPEIVEGVAHEARVERGGERFEAVHLPGSTPGSVAWVWRDVVFTGSAVVGDPLRVLPNAFTGDPTQARGSLERLLPYGVAWLADGHSGLHADARAKLFSLLERPVGPAEHRWEGQDAAEPGAVALAGIYRQAPAPTPDGRWPADLLLDDGRRLRVADQPVEGHRPLWNRRVVGVGRLEAGVVGSLDPQQATARLAEGARLRLAEGEPPSVGPIDPFTGPDQRGRLVRLRGRLEGLKPLQEGSALGSATLGGVPVVVRWAYAEHAGAEVTAWGTVAPRDPLLVVVRHVCPGDAPACGEAISRRVNTDP